MRHLDEIVNLLRSRFGTSLSTIPLVHGEESRAYRFSHRDREYVIRFNRSRGGFDKDAFVNFSFSSAAVPIPEIIEIGPFQKNGFFCISDCAAGVTLQDLSCEQLSASLIPTARVLQAIKESDISGTAGFGPFNATGVAPFASWRQYLRSIADPQLYDWNLVAKICPSVTMEPILETVIHLSDFCPETRHLVHGDFGSNNVLIEGDRITGVIDWSEALFGDPLYDIANIFFWRTWLMCMEDLATFYERTLLLDSHMRERLLCYQLQIGLRETYGRALTGDPNGTLWAASRTQGIRQSF